MTDLGSFPVVAHELAAINGTWGIEPQGSVARYRGHPQLIDPSGKAVTVPTRSEPSQPLANGTWKVQWVAEGSTLPDGQSSPYLVGDNAWVRLRVDYFDAYENLLNASRIVHAGTFYSIARPPFYPLMLTPIALLARLAHSPELEFVSAHVLAVALFALLLLMTFLIFRLFLGRLTALLGVALLSSNLLLINNAPQAKEDIPGALFTTAAFYFYLRGRTRERPRDFVLAGALIGAAIGTRYNLLPVPFLVIGVYEVIALVSQIANGRWDRSQFRLLLAKFGALGVLPVVLYFLWPVIVYPAAHQASVTGAPLQYIKDVIFLVQANAFKEDSDRKSVV